nr:DUF2589 domain-containing protein [uncultured Draconibacterium sp.]
MVEVSKKPLKPNFDSDLNIESIISAPLVAASKANVVMVTGQTRFLLDYCFKKNKETDTYEPEMVNMVMVKGLVDNSKKTDDPDYIQKVEMTFSMPLICLVPLNSLAVDKVNVDFDMEIVSMTSYEYINAGGVIDKRAQLNGRITNKKEDSKMNPSEQYKSQSKSRLSVNISAGPLPLPVGVTTLLDLYTKSIQPITKNTD